MQSGMTIGTASDPTLPKSVTRVLQHSILQLCNEHIAYNHTLQVLGVLCLTIDDKQQELVVKVNNTLKRVNPVTSPKDALTFPAPGMPRGDSELCLAASEVPLMYDAGACANGAFAAKGCDKKRSSSGGGQLSSTGRRGHGRKQTNPVRVKHVYDEGSGDISDGDVLTVEPTNPLSPCALEGGTQEATPSRDAIPLRGQKRIGGIRKTKRKLTELFSSPKKNGLDEGSGASGQLVARRNIQGRYDEGVPHANLEDALTKKSVNEAVEKMVGCDDSEEESRDSGCSRRLVVIAPEDVSSSENLEDAGTSTAEDGVLNFSMCALNGGTHQVEKVDAASVSGAKVATPMSGSGQEYASCLQTDLSGVRVKEEMKGVYPLGFDLVMNATSYDVSQNLAIRTTFLDDRRFLPSMAHGSLTNGHVTSQNPLVSELCSTSNSALRYLGDASGATSIHLLDDAYLRSMVNGLSVAQVAVGPASYTISSCLKDGLTMHLTKTRTKDRSLVGGTSMKVKDIIMFDDSAPLHTQKGSKIEGDFMLDSLNVEGKKRRRRTAEDALTSEEIAEYMGTCDRNHCSFKCKYCSEVCPDLSRYFNHTLVKHNSFICHQCGKNFTTKSSLLRHRPIHTGMRRFACSICKKSFYRKDKCKAHIKRHLGLGPDPPEKYPHASLTSA